MTSFGGNKKYSNPYAEAIYTRFKGIEKPFFYQYAPYPRIGCAIGTAFVSVMANAQVHQQRSLWGDAPLA